MALQNDWIVASLSNPTLDTFELSTLGDLDTKNTLFLSRDEYLKSNFIRNNDNFKDENGNFSEQKFNDYYNQQVERWGEFQNNTFPTGLKLDFFDESRKKDSRVIDDKFYLGEAYNPKYGLMGNPDKVKIGIEGWDIISEPEKTESEIAQGEKIYDSKSKKFLDETPEDRALFENPFKFVKSIFQDPLTLAVYEKDEIDEYGIQHKKGERKLNDNGTYYYETLNGRSPMNRNILSLADILTKEDSILNHINFMDSDDREKSVGGIIAKNVALLAPMFITKNANWYYKAMIAKEMVRAMPMLYQVSSNLFGKGNVQSPEWINRLASIGENLTTGSSAYSKEHVFSFENFANLVSDVALQWGQQKYIAQKTMSIVDGSKLADAEKRAKMLYDVKSTGNLKNLAQLSDEEKGLFLTHGFKESDLWKQTTLGKMCIEKTLAPVQEMMNNKAKYGQSLALAYMAIISNTDVYADMKERGATDKEAAWVTLGSTIGMFSVDKFAHIGEVFFDDEKARVMNELRRALKPEIDEVKNKIYKGVTKKETPKTLFNKGLNLGKKLGEKIGNYWNDLKNHDLGAIGKAVGEGLEEVSEEAIADVSRGLYSILGDMGLYDKSVKDPIDWDHMVERYSMNFLGGVVGGGLFYAHDKFANRFNNTQDRDLLRLVREGKAADLRNMVLDMRNKGELGSQTLSGTEYSRNEGSDLVTWLSATNKETSQNDQIANKILDKINSLEATVVGNNANLNDDQLFENMVLSEMRYLRFKNAAYVTGYYDEFDSRLRRLVAAEAALKEASKTPDGNPGTDKELTDAELRNPQVQAIREKNLATLQLKVDNAKKDLDDFLSGDTSLEYTRKLNFLLDPYMNSVFLGLDFEQWVKENNYNLDYSDPTKLEEINKKWVDHVKDVMKSDKVEQGFKAFLALEDLTKAEMLGQVELGKQYKASFEALNSLFELNEDSTDYKYSFNDFIRKNKFYDENSRLVDENGVEESDEVYENRYDESTPDAVNARKLRRLKISELNRQLLQEYVKPFEEVLQPLGYKVDASTARELMYSMRLRMKDVIQMEADQANVMDGSFFDPKPYLKDMGELNDDLSNVELVREAMTQKLYDSLQKAVDKFKDSLSNSIKENVILDPYSAFQGTDSKRRIKDTILNMSDDEAVERINLINEELKDKNDLLKAYFKGIGKEKLETKEDLITLLLNFIGSAPSGSRAFGASRQFAAIFDAIKYNSRDVLEEDFAQLPAILNLLAKYGTSYTTEQMLEELQNVKEEYNDLMKLLLPQSTFESELGVIDGFMALVDDSQFSEYTIKSLLDELSQPGINPETGEVDEAFKSPAVKFLEDKFGLGQHLSTNLANSIYKLINGEDKNIDLVVPFGLDAKLGIFSSVGNTLMDDSNVTIARKKKAVSTYLNDVVNRIKTNPITQLYDKLQVTLNSPIEGLVKRVASELGGENINVNEVLQSAYNKYVDVKNSLDFELEPGQMNQLNVAQKALQMVASVIYAASTKPGKDSFFGQNHQINEFARNHKDRLVKQWDELPEIDEQYATLLEQEVERLYKEVQLWKALSDLTTMNKIRRLSESASLDSKLKYEALRNVSLKFTAGGKEYDLKEGVDDVNEHLPETFAEKLKTMYAIEQLIHNNFKNAVKESKLSEDQIFEEIFKQGGSLNLDPVNMAQQRVVLLNSSKGVETLGSYDFSLYLLSIFSDDPAKYYESVIRSIKANENIVPLTVQLNISRLGEAAHTDTFKKGFKVIAKNYNKNRTVTPHLFHINGIAGAGKTEVVIKDIRQRYKDVPALVIGPTTQQSVKLQNVLNESTSYTLDESDPNNIFRKLLGPKEWTKLSKEYSGLEEELNNKIAHESNASEVKADGTHMTLIYYNDDDSYGVRIELKEGISFAKDFNLKLIFADEAAHMNPLQLALLNEYCEQKGATAYLASDTNLSGYSKGPIENLNSVSLYCPRIGKLTESLRSANIQMQQNAQFLEVLLDEAEDVFNYGSIDDQNYFMERINKIVKGAKYRVYDGGDDINGYLFGAKLEETILKLKRIVAEKQAKGEPITIGFIGKSDSEAYQHLVNSGLPMSEALSSEIVAGEKFMQGLEFDYVVIDHFVKGNEMEVDSNGTSYNSDSSRKFDKIDFLKKFNTIATRGKAASIFLDGKTITDIFGESQVDKSKSPGFSISSYVTSTKQQYLDAFSKLELKPYDDEDEDKPKPKKKVSKKKVDKTKSGEPEEEEVEIPAEEEEITTEDDEEGRKVVNVPDTLKVLEFDPQVKVDNLVKQTEELIQTVSQIENEGSDENPNIEDIDLEDFNEFEDEEEEGETTSELEQEEIEPNVSLNNEGRAVLEANTLVPMLGLEKVPGEKYENWVPFDASSNPPVRRNLQCFCTTDKYKDGPITELSKKRELQGLLDKVLKYVLFGGSVPNGSEFDGFDWNNLRLSVNIRVAGKSDVFGIDTDLSEDELPKIDGKRYVISIVAEVPFSRISGVTGEMESYDALFDILLMSDPNKLNTPERLTKIKENLGKLITKCDLKIDSGKLKDVDIKALELQKDRLNNLIKTIDSTAVDYNKNIKKLVKQVKNTKRTNTEVFIDLNNSDYTLHKTTLIVHRTTPRRFGGHVSIANVENNVLVTEGKHAGEYALDIDTFLDRGTPKIVSPVYILGKKGQELKGKVSDSVFGKAVVFTSTNTNLNPNDLAELYLKQKADPLNNTPQVRMGVLMNHGISFRELCYHTIQKLLSKEYGHSGKPHRMDYLGIGMFASIWNFRAALYNFKNAYETWMKGKTFDITALLAAEAKFFNEAKEWGYKNTQDALSQEKADDRVKNFKYIDAKTKQEFGIADIQELVKFNYEICKDIPIFRLGYDFAVTANWKKQGAFIRPFSIHPDSKVYGDDAKKHPINLLAIEPHTITTFSNLLDIILGQIVETPEEWNKVNAIANDEVLKSLRTKITHKDGSPIDATEYIGKSDEERNLSGMIHTLNGVLYIQEDMDDPSSKSYGIPPEAIFSYFPKMITSIVSHAKVYQHAPDKRSYNKLGISVVRMEGEEEVKDEYDFEIGDLFGKDKLDDDPSDNTLMSMFELIFHGSTESLEKWRVPRGEGEPLKRAYLYDAYYKYGFLADPELEFHADKSVAAEVNIGPEGDRQAYVLLKCDAPYEYFDVDFDVRCGGIGLDWDNVISKINNKEFRIIDMNDWENREERKEVLTGVEDLPHKDSKELIQQGGYSETLGDDKGAFITYIEGNKLDDSEKSYEKFKIFTRIDNISKLKGESFNIKLEGDLYKDDIISLINEQLAHLKNEIRISDLDFTGGKRLLKGTNGKYYDFEVSQEEGVSLFESDDLTIDPSDQSSIKLNFDRKLQSVKDLLSELIGGETVQKLISDRVLGIGNIFKTLVNDVTDDVSFRTAFNPLSEDSDYRIAILNLTNYIASDDANNLMIDNEELYFKLFDVAQGLSDLIEC